MLRWLAPRRKVIFDYIKTLVLLISITIGSGSSVIIQECNGPYTVYLNLISDFNIITNRYVESPIKDINIYHYNVMDNGNEIITINITEYKSIQIKDPGKMERSVSQILKRNGVQERTIETDIYKIRGCAIGYCVGIKGMGDMIYTFHGRGVKAYALEYWLDRYIDQGIDIRCTVLSKLPEESQSVDLLSSFDIIRQEVN